MKIRNISNLSNDELHAELKRGAKFIRFAYCLSFLFWSSQKYSDIYLVRAERSLVFTSARFCVISLLLGWWAIPFGPVRTIRSLRINLNGGMNVSAEVINALRSYMRHKKRRK
jgi:hypothetical protein